LKKICFSLCVVTCALLVSPVIYSAQAVESFASGATSSVYPTQAKNKKERDQLYVAYLMGIAVLAEDDLLGDSATRDSAALAQIRDFMCTNLTKGISLQRSVVMLATNYKDGKSVAGSSVYQRDPEMALSYVSVTFAALKTNRKWCDPKYPPPQSYSKVKKP
jgi:hypothetical protein